MTTATRSARSRLVLTVTLLATGVAVPVFSRRVILSKLLAHTLVAVTVRGASMEPTYHDGDRVLVRRGGLPKVGQVVVVERYAAGPTWHRPACRRRTFSAEITDRDWLIKRIVAIPGDLVPRDQAPALCVVCEDRVPPGKLVLFGDNRKASVDSRQMGYFPAERVLGFVVRSLSC